MEYKKVPGERIVAAIIDYIFVQIITVIFGLIPVIILGFDATAELFIGSLNESNGMIEGDLAIAFVLFSYVTILGSIIWLVIMPRFMNGQTVGKKIMKIKAINQYGDNPSLWQHFIRSAQNWPNYYLAIIVWLMTVDYMLYTVASFFSFFIQIAVFVTLIMFLARRDGRGFHDLISGTYVVGVDDNGDRKFAEATAQMSEWAEVVDPDDDGFMEETEKKDEWDF